MRAPLGLVVFGSLIAETQAIYQDILYEATERYPGREIELAYTSSAVRRHFHGRGSEALNPGELLARWTRGGHRTVVLQSFHIAPGAEFKQLADLRRNDQRVHVGAPLLASNADYRAAMEAIAPHIRTDVPTVVVVHGNESSPLHNEPFLKLGEHLGEHYPDVIAASIEGEPGFTPLLAARERLQQAGTFHLLPFMLVAGGHIVHDILGHHPDSWASRLNMRRITCAPPLGTLSGIRRIFFQHAETALRAADKD